MTQEIDAGVHLFTSEYWRQTPHWSTNDRGFNEKVKIILKLQVRQTAPMGQAGKVQIGWVVCKMGRKPAKRLHSESGDQSVSSSGPHSSRKSQKDWRGSKRVPWPLRNGRRRSLPWRREAWGGISSHYSGNYSWVTTKRTDCLYMRNHMEKERGNGQFTSEKVSSLYKRKLLQWE